jgi:hypothetical protein
MTMAGDHVEQELARAGAPALSDSSPASTGKGLLEPPPLEGARIALD